jgi:hypothetical protein
MHPIVGKVISPFFAIGDPKYTSCKYIIPGFSATQNQTLKRKIFTIITKKEQKKIEWIFQRLRTYDILKFNFRHSKFIMVHSFSIICSLYNYKKSIGYYKKLNK